MLQALYYPRFTVPERISGAKFILLFLFAAQMAFQYPLWSGVHLYPRISLTSWMQWPMDSVGPAVYSMLLVLLLICLLTYRNPNFWRLCVSFIFLWMLFDVNRFQAYAIYLGIMAFLLAFYNGRVNDDKHYSAIWVGLQVIFSGNIILQAMGNIGHSLFHQDWTQWIQPLKGFFNAEEMQVTENCGYAIPFLEITLAIAIFFDVSKRIAIPLLAWLHYLYFALSLFQADGSLADLRLFHFCNPLLLYILFCGKLEHKHFHFSDALQFVPLYLSVFLLLFFFAKGYRLHLGNTAEKATQAGLQVHPKLYRQLPYYVRAQCHEKTNGFYFLSLTKWASHETRVHQLVAEGNSEQSALLLNALTGHAQDEELIKPDTLANMTKP